MRNLKKVLALVIAFSMMLSVVAFAGYNDVDADADYAGAVELLSALNIFKGDENGNFNPDNTITRAEMAAIICRAKGLEDQAAGSAGATMFADVAADHWASGYINLASQNGIINGYGDGNFGPDDTVTYEQAIKMLVCTLGYEPMAQAKGGWSTGYLVVANTYKLTEGAAANATRANLAILVANALEIPMMDQTSFGSDEKFERLNKEDNYTTLLTSMDIYVLTGTVDANTNDKTYVKVEIEEDSADFEFKEYVDAAQTTRTAKQTVYVGTTDIAAYEYQTVDVYVKKNARKDYTALAVVDANIGQTLSIVSDAIDGNLTATGNANGDLEIKYFVDPANSDDTDEILINLDKIEINKATFASQQSNAIDSIAGFDEALDIDGDNNRDSDLILNFIDADGDDVYTKLVITRYISDLVDSVEVDKDKIGFQGRNYTLDFEADDKTIIIRDMDGNVLTLADLAEDDMIAVSSNVANLTNAKYVEIVKLDNAAVTGKVESTWTSAGTPYVSINGNEYANASRRAIATGDEGTYYIGMTGKIVNWKATSAVGNYGIILEAGIATAAFGNTWQLKILTVADGVVTYEVDKDLANQAAFTNLLSSIDGWEIVNGNPTNKVLWVRPTAGQQYDRDRLVEFETDSKGLIDELIAANGTKSYISANAEYSENTQKIDGKTLEDDVVIFYLDKANADDVYATDLSYLVDDSNYEGFIFKDAQNSENCVMVVTKGTSPFKAENGFAVVTRRSEGQTAEGDKIYTISYVLAEEAGTITFTDDSEDNYPAAQPDLSNAQNTGDAYKYLEAGDVILFNADGEGVVTNYAVVARYDETNDNFVVDTNVQAAYTAQVFGEDANIHQGYLYHYETGNKVDSAYIAPTTNVAGVGDVVMYELPVAAYKYTYNDVNAKNVKIDTGDYRSTVNTEYWTKRDANAQTHATPVVFVEIDGSIVDIISADKAVAVSFVDVPAITQ